MHLTVEPVSKCYFKPEFSRPDLRPEWIYPADPHEIRKS